MIKNHPQGPVGPATTAGAVLLAETTAAASGAYAATSVIDVRGYRTITLFLNVDCAAAGGYPELVPRLAYEDLSTTPGTAPAFGDDVWYPYGITDGTPTATLRTGTRVTGVDYTGAPEWNVLTYRPLSIRTEAHDASTNEIRMTVALDVSAAAWFSIEYAEIGATGTPSAVGVKYVLSS